MSASEARRPRAHAAIEALERVAVLDGAADAISKWVRGAVPKGAIKDGLSGSWLGHALHPMLTDVPIGLWTSAIALDWLGGRDARAAADRLIALGLGGAVPAVVTGASDWADSTPGNPPVKRVGIVHATSNTVAAVLFASSWAARRRGTRGKGKALALAGGGALVGGGFLGGHLSFARGIGVDQTVFEPRPEEWHDALAASELPEREPRVAEVDGVPVLLVRDGAEVLALSDTCAHRGGALHEGELHDGCVTCPLHGSTFRLRDGSLVRGPSAYPQPAWQTRERAGRVEVRRAG
jgi:nitrite reductase/ring-hydroxylating ferredoxin subunit